MDQLHHTLLGNFCQRIEIASSISVAESFNDYCSFCLSLWVRVFFCLNVMYKCKDTFIHVDLCQIFWAVQEGTLFYTVVVWLILLLPLSPQLSDQFSNACLLFLLLLFQIRPKYRVWTSKCQGICTWQITNLAGDGMGRMLGGFCNPWGLTLGEQLQRAHPSPASPARFCLLPLYLDRA